MERKTRLGQKCLTPRNKKKLTKIVFQIFVNFGLFPKELLFAPTVYSELESVAKLIFSFVPRSFFFFEISEKPDFWTPFIREFVEH
ncbi:hypothetical protein LIU_12310 [Enterococcus durans]|nr:hypothetical protein LIANG_03875 [Enterococcus durans]AKZ49379.1 hypothetical protein LIU_12310 [Enterococcus durans]